MKRTVICLVIFIAGMVTKASSQTPSDSLKQGVRKYIARNFSEARTLNLYWQKTPSHNYTLLQNGKEIEKGEFKHINTVKFSVTIPVLLLKNFSLYANGQFNSYQFEARNKIDGKNSAIFSKNNDGYNYYEGTLTGTYRTRFVGKPLILIASAFADGWNKGFEKTQGMFSAIMVLKQSSTSSFSAGLYGTTLYEKIPIIPIIAYSHQLTPNWSIDLTLPSRSYIRYQLNNHRFSAGASLDSEHFYMGSRMENLPKVSFFNKTTIKPEIVYEYIINKHFYLIARGGGSALVSGGLYGTNRKGINGDPYIKFKQPITPFFNIGFSYNLFK